VTPDDEDVLEEENTVKWQVNEGLIDPNVAVQIRGLAKVYTGSTNTNCCKCKRTPPYHALRVRYPFSISLSGIIHSVRQNGLTVATQSLDELTSTPLIF